MNNGNQIALYGFEMCTKLNVLNLIFELYFLCYFKITAY